MRNTPILLLITVTTLIRLAFGATTGLGVDESYMVAAGRHWAVGYFDHPLASWWLSHGAAVLLGSEAPVAVRLPFILLFALSQFLVCRIGCQVADRRAGFWAAAALNLSPVFGITTGTWVLPDGPLDAALLGAALCLMNALACRGDRRGLVWWGAAGGLAGLAMLSKYSAVLVIGGAGLHLLASKQARLRFRTPGPYVAALAAAVAFSPVLIWNASHGWASFAFQGDRALGLRFHPFAPLATLGGEALFVLPWLWLPMMLLLIQAFRSGAPWRDRLLAWLAVPPIAVFALVSVWSGQRILFHWAAPGYLMLMPLLGQAIAVRIGQPWVRRTLAGTAALTLAALAIISTQIQFDWLGGSLAAVVKKDPTAEGLDWTSVRDDLAARGLLPAPPTGARQVVAADQTVAAKPDRRADPVVAALSWRDAGKFGYALGPSETMLCLSTDAREFGFAEPPSGRAGRDVVVLSLDAPPRALQTARPWFESVDLLAPSSVRLRGRTLLPVTVMLGHGLRPAP